MVGRTYNPMAAHIMAAVEDATYGSRVKPAPVWVPSPFLGMSKGFMVDGLSVWIRLPAIELHVGGCAHG